MQKKKTRTEIATQPYLCINDIRTLFSVSYATAKRIYGYAKEIDDKEVKHKIFPTKVRMTSVCKVTGQSLKTVKTLAGQ